MNGRRLIYSAAIGAVLSAGLAGAPLFIGAGMKITYDLLLWREFRRLRPPEERDS